MVRAGLDLPVVDGDAVERAGRRGIAEGDHGVVAHRAREDIAEDHGRTAGAGEGDAEAAAFAGVVEGDVRLGEVCAFVVGPGVGQRRPRIGLAGGARGRPVALVEPGGEDLACRIDRHRLEALAGRVGGERLRLGEGRPAVGRARMERAPVEVLVLEYGEGDDRHAFGIDGDARPRVGAPVEVERLGRHRDWRREGPAEVGRARDHDPAALGPHQPQRAVGSEGRRGGEGLRRPARRVIVLRAGGAGGQQEGETKKQPAHRRSSFQRLRDIVRTSSGGRRWR